MCDEFFEDSIIFRHEVGIFALFYDTSVIDDRHLVCGLYGAESVCYSEHGAVSADIL